MVSLGRYELVAQAGAGGMGTVYRAHDPQLERVVAIKVLRLDQFEDPGQRRHLIQRFQTEARAAARLRHPNIVAVYDFADEQGEVYLVMEFVEGQDLAKRSRQPLSVAETLRILRETAAALDHAHSQGVVHRDVKPANLLIQPDGSAKLTDFGIARITAMGGLTMAGQTLGTPHYMAPEAIDPSEERPVNERSDQFSFAVVAYELLSGRRPFEADTLGALSMRILRAEVPPVTIGEPQVAEELNRIFQRALAKDPNDRYPSCRTLVVEIEAACRGLKEIVRPVKPAVSQAEATATAPQDAVRGDDAPTRVTSPVVAGLDPTWVSGPRSDAFIPAAVPQTPPRPPTPVPVAVPPPVPATVSAARPPWKLIAPLVGVALLAGLAYLYSRGDEAPKPAPAKATAPAAPDGMVLVAEGEAILGPTATRTEVGAFYIDRTEVTNRAFLEFCKATQRDCTAMAGAEPDLPVVSVSFDEADGYAKWAGKRLPTWIEWEKAARGSQGQAFPWGREFRADAVNLPLDRDAVRAAKLAAASAYPAGASPSGALNMLGNAWEWVASSAAPDARHFADLQRVFSSLTPPLSRTESYYQIRGGSFKSPFPAEALPMLVFDWSSMPARIRGDDIGFRCVKDF